MAREFVHELTDNVHKKIEESHEWEEPYLLDVAIGKLDLIGISTKDINKNLTAKQYNETQIVELTLYWRSAEEGVKILEAINSVSPAILIDTLKIGGVSVVNKPTARYIIGGSVNASLWI